MSEQIQIGDYVIIPTQAPAYRGGHVEQMHEGELYLGYGRKEETPFFRLHSYPVSVSKVSEIYRKKRVIKRDSFEMNGATIQVVSVEYEWDRVTPYP
jgi:hypothetical protein